MLTAAVTLFGVVLLLVMVFSVSFAGKGSRPFISL